jgi:hypothetical protein
MEIYCCPARCLAWFGISEEKQIHAGFLFSTLAVMAVAPVLQLVPHVCLFQFAFGLPCPGCGITHSVLALIHFDFVGAWRQNPAGLFLAACLLYQLGARPLAMVRPHLQFRVNALSMWMGRTSLAVLLSVWLVRFTFKLVSGGIHWLP